jgi:hypothetical protein
VLLDPAAKRMAIEALETIDRAVERGPLAPAPADGALRVVRVPAGVRAGESAPRRAQAAELPEDLSG